jgi:hypothetical protein
MQNSGPPTINAIRIGRPTHFKQLHTEGNYAVFLRERGPGEPDLYVIGRPPQVTERQFQPASAIETFRSEALAVETLKRWALDPLPPAPPPKLRKPGAYRRNSNRERPYQIGAGQLELNL